MFIKFWKTLKKKNKRMTAMPRLMQKLIKILLPYVHFKALFFWANFPGPTFIPCPMSILDSRVKGMAEGLKIRRGE
jgi:hypothetical protein